MIALEQLLGHVPKEQPVHGAGEIAQLENCLLCNHEDLSLIPKIHTKVRFDGACL